METGRDAFGIRSLNRHTLEQIVAASPAAVLIADATSPELPVVYANAAYERLTGYPLAELAGQPWGALGRAAAGDETLASLKAEIAGGKVCRAAIPDVRKDGTPFTCEISVTPLHGPRGDLRYFLLSHELTASAQQGETLESAADGGSEQRAAAARARPRAPEDRDARSHRSRHGPAAIPLLSRDAAARSRDGAPRPPLRHAAHIRDRRVRRLPADVRRQGCRLLPAHDRRADHARVAPRRRSMRALRRHDVGRSRHRAARRRRSTVWSSESQTASSSSSSTIRAPSRAGISRRA